MDDQETYYYILQPGFRSRGPFPLSHLRRWAREGRIGPETAFSMDGTHWIDGNQMVSVFPNEELVARRRAALRRELRTPKHAKGKTWGLAAGAILLAGLAAPFFVEKAADPVMRSLGLPVESVPRLVIGGILGLVALSLAWLARGFWVQAYGWGRGAAPQPGSPPDAPAGEPARPDPSADETHGPRP